MIKKEEVVSCYTHLVAGIFAIAGTLYLALSIPPDPVHFAVVIIYGLSITLLFSASALYHAKKRHENEQSIWRKLDHSAIFLMIAGTYTPIAYLYLSDLWFVIIISAQWTLVFFGFFFKFFYRKATGGIFTGIYIAMGWMAVIPMHNLVNIMPGSQLLLLIGGGVAFTIGAAVYAIKKPVFRNGIFGFHEIFHVMVIIGAVCHYAVVYRGFLA